MLLGHEIRQNSEGAKSCSIPCKTYVRSGETQLAVCATCCGASH